MKDSLTFAGLPACTDMSALEADAAIIGIPHGTPYHPGRISHAAGGPTAIRAASQKYAVMTANHDFDLGGPLMSDRNFSVMDCGDVPGDPSDPAGNREKATARIKAVLETGAVPIVIGGDDSIPIPVFAAFEDRGPLTLVQIDAHLDWRHDVDGEIFGYSSTMRRAFEKPWITKIVQIGMRGVGSATPLDVNAATAAGVSIVTARDVEEKGIDGVLDFVPPNIPCFITFDCDGLDPSVMPAVQAPSPGGLTYRQVTGLIHGIAEKTRIAGFNLVELAPDRDLNGIGALTAARIVWNVIGGLARARR